MYQQRQDNTKSQSNAFLGKQPMLSEWNKERRADRKIGKFTSVRKATNHISCRDVVW
jgi:hypothetical protein